LYRLRCMPTGASRDPEDREPRASKSNCQNDDPRPAANPPYSGLDAAQLLSLICHLGRPMLVLRLNRIVWRLVTRFHRSLPPACACQSAGNRTPKTFSRHRRPQFSLLKTIERSDKRTNRIKIASSKPLLLAPEPAEPLEEEVGKEWRQQLGMSAKSCGQAGQSSSRGQR
jgi:hypothetical protein